MHEAVLLVGGLGSRLRSELGGLPKPMVDIGGQPFLERVMLHLRSFGIRRFILAVSYNRECIERRFGDGDPLGISVEYSREIQPLGTAGALRNALRYLLGEQVLVLNGDSFADVNYVDLIGFHQKHGGALTLTAVQKLDCRDFGRLQISDDRVLSFLEKNDSDCSPGYINAGVYVFDRGLVETIQPGVVQSLEKDLFPSLLAGGHRIHAYSTDCYFMDLGTPQRLQQLREDFSQGLVQFPANGGLKGLALGYCRPRDSR